MTNTKNKKVVSIIMIAIMLIVTMSNICFAAGTGKSSITPSSISADAGDVSDDMQSVGNKIFGFIQTAGVIIAVVIIAVIGVKYLMGSAEEKAEYKKTMIPYVIGAVLVAAAPTIANMIYTFGSSIGD